MAYEEIYQLMKYKRDELSSRLKTIKEDFETSSTIDDVLFTIAHQTKVELMDIKNIIINIEQGSFGVCEKCSLPINSSTLEINPFVKTCDNCTNKTP